MIAGYIYKITNTINGKVIIGQTIQKVENRWGQYRSLLRRDKYGNEHLQNAWNKYGEVAFKFEVIDQVVFESSLDNLERFWIKYYDSMNPEKGYNLESGGNLGRVKSEETRKKHSKSLQGKKHTQERIKKNSDSHKGKLRSKESKLKQSMSSKGHKKPPRTKETRLKMSVARLGKPAPNRRKVIDIATGQEWESVKQASLAHGLNHIDLARKLRGERPNTTNLKYINKE